MYVNYNLKLNPSTFGDLYRQMWLHHHRGVLTMVANQLQVSPQMVRMVFWGQRKSQRIEQALSSHGFSITGTRVRNNVKSA
jgi:hypothetical protein